MDKKMPSHMSEIQGLTLEAVELRKQMNNKMPCHISEIQDLTLKAIELRKKIADKILGLPDNPNIKQRDGKGFIVSSASLMSTLWNVAYHDFKLQYQAVVKELAASPVENTVQVLSRIVDTGFVQESKTNRFRLHPDVIKHLKELL
jgi:hypothetical protein